MKLKITAILNWSKNEPLEPNFIHGKKSATRLIDSTADAVSKFWSNVLKFSEEARDHKKNMLALAGMLRAKSAINLDVPSISYISSAQDSK